MKIVIISALSAAVLLLLSSYIKRKKTPKPLTPTETKSDTSAKAPPVTNPQPTTPPHIVEQPAEVVTEIKPTPQPATPVIAAVEEKPAPLEQAVENPEPIAVVVPESISENIEAFSATEITLESPAEDSENIYDESILTRHRLSNIRMMLANTRAPRPTDSALSRHYDLLIDDEAEKCLEDDARMERLLRAYDNYKKSQAIPTVTTFPFTEKKIIPEDATLRRHYISQLRATIEAAKAERPTDSTLRRHYDAMINAEIAQHLSVD